jgi:two-component sensor histidine kinase
VDVRDVSLDIDTSITCGLLVNELLSNALKHAFPGGRDGEIIISMHPGMDGGFALTFADNGVGLPSSLNREKPETLGITLIGSLVRQLEGKLEIISDHGAQFTITFPGI